METPYDLRLATVGKRCVAFFINLILIGISNIIPLDFIMDEGARFYASYLLFAIWPIVFSVFPESPGMRALSLVVLDTDKKKISVKKRFCRNSIFIIYFSTAMFIAELPLEIAKYGAGTLYFLFFVFLLANSMTLLVNPTGLSLIDMKTDTRVYQIPKVTGLLKPY